MIHPMIYVGLPPRGQVTSRLKRRLCEFDSIISATCEVLSVDRELVFTRLKKRHVVDARCIAIGLILQVNPDMRLKQLGAIFGRDHSTIIYNRDLFKDLYNRNLEFTQKVNAVLKLV